MKLKIVIDKLNGFAPNDYQESFDNSGLQIGDVNSEIVKVLVCLDVTEKVINEAISIGANLIVSHHPLIFHGIKHITEKTYIERWKCGEISGGKGVDGISNHVRRYLFEKYQNSC